MRQLVGNSVRQTLSAQSSREEKEEKRKSFSGLKEEGSRLEETGFIHRASGTDDGRLLLCCPVLGGQ